MNIPSLAEMQSITAATLRSGEATSLSQEQRERVAAYMLHLVTRACNSKTSNVPYFKRSLRALRSGLVNGSSISNKPLCRKLRAYDAKAFQDLIASIFTEHLAPKGLKASFPVENPENDYRITKLTYLLITW